MLFFEKRAKTSETTSEMISHLISKPDDEVSSIRQANNPFVETIL